MIESHQGLPSAHGGFEAPGEPRVVFVTGHAQHRGHRGSLATVLVGLVGIVLFIGALLVISAVFVVAIVAALVTVGLHQVVHAVRRHPRDQPMATGGFRPAAVIDTTASVIRVASTRPANWSDRTSRPDGDGPEGDGPAQHR
jgi:hypothetical protein